MISGTAVSRKIMATRLNGRFLPVAAVAHALLVLVAWWAMFSMDVELISARQWLVGAWLWAVWPFILVLHPARSAWPISIALGSSALLLAPCVPTMFAFTVWTFGGFR
ncbi:hypothetical protein V1291_004929 [Nitrobacteraceae bacterium AZCC 1564]